MRHFIHIYIKCLKLGIQTGLPFSLSLSFTKARVRDLGLFLLIVHICITLLYIINKSEEILKRFNKSANITCHQNALSRHSGLPLLHRLCYYLHCRNTGRKRFPHSVIYLSSRCHFRGTRLYKPGVPAWAGLPLPHGESLDMLPKGQRVVLHQCSTDGLNFECHTRLRLCPLCTRTFTMRHQPHFLHLRFNPLLGPIQKSTVYSYLMLFIHLTQG